MFVRLMKIKIPGIIIGSIFLITIGVLASFFFIKNDKYNNNSLPSVANESYDYRTEKAILAKVFNSLSSKEVYELFKDRYSQIDQTKVHNLAHWIGTEIYSHGGMDGLLICDEAFSYGCYHGFFIKAFEKEGKDLYQSGDRYCFGDGSQPLKYGGCIHGLGHGVLYLNGYDINGLKGALEDCESLASISSISGCNNGVFMEYNTRTMQSLDTGEIELRPLDSNNPLEPCNEIDGKYSNDCYFEQPAWWAGVYFNDFQKMVELCEGVIGKSSKENCFGGVGRMIPIVDQYQGNKIKEVCMSISSGSYQSYCIEKSVEVLLGVGKQDSMGFCNLLSADFAKQCHDKMNQYYCVITNKCQTKQ